MIKRPTVLILGAGASAPFGFPPGRKLLDDICRGLSREAARFFRLLRECGFDANTIATFRDALRQSGQPSVDVFLEYRPEFLELGKTAIAASLIAYEIEGKLLEVKGNWYGYLFQRLGPSLLRDVARSRLSVITFNYDRSLDQFLFLALQNAFNLKAHEAVRFLKKIPIVHVYGTLGELPHVGGGGTRPYRRSDPARTVTDALAAKDSIKIVPKGAEGDVDFGRSLQMLGEAEVVCFLGFGYLPDNVERLGLERRTAGTRLWGSAYAVGEGAREPIMTLFSGDPNKRPIRLGAANQDALEFLKRHPILVGSSG